VGAQATAGSFEFYVSAEWFAAVNTYDVLETRPIESDVPPASYDLPLTQSRKDVLNFGAGVSVEVRPWLSFFGSARTDKSYRDAAEQPAFVGLGAYDLYHVTAGIGASNESLEVVLGGLYATGDSSGPLTLSPAPNSPTVDTHTEFSQTGFILAFSASF
jgi:hypothetical protein